MIEPFTGKQRKKRFLVYDLEWYPKTLQLRLAGLFDGADYHSFVTIGDFLDFVLRRKYNKATFFAHAGGLYDVQFLFEWLLNNPHRYKVTSFFSGSSAVLVKITDGTNSWTFCDSFWLLRDSLARIGESLGRHKTADSWQCEAKRRDGVCEHEGKCMFYAPMKELRDYNEQDCRILHDAIERFEDEILGLGGELRCTIASTALHLFRSSYLKSAIETSPEVNLEIRSSYIASRVEVLQRESGPGNYYDINSSFPNSMKSPLPGTLRSIGDRLPKAGTLWFADCEVSVPEMYFPPIAYRKHFSGKVFFPWGQWRAWFSRPDLENALGNGVKITKVHKAYTFEPFYEMGEYVDDIYGRRQRTGDAFSRLTYKNLMNNLYGKFAESEEKTTIVLNPDSFECPHGGAHKVGSVSECVEMIQPGVIAIDETREIPHAHIPITAWITAASRVALGKRVVEQILPANRDLYYLDTDSLLTDATLETSPNLGQLKLEKTFQHGRFLAPKLYALDEDIKAKGFSKLTIEEFNHLWSNPHAHVKRQRMLRIKELLRKGLTAPTEVLAEKRLSSDNFTKRRFLSDGKTVPWNVKEL